MPEVCAVLRNKDKNYKESFQNLQECVFQYMVENYKNEVDLVPLISTLKDVDLSSNKPTAPTGTGNRDPKEISKKIFELELGKIWIGQISWKTI